ncbi:hypothetical protein LQW54_000972 [Pestalotiopsis sp. IQ-011]
MIVDFHESRQCEAFISYFNTHHIFSMDATILVIGATGNTGKNVLRTLPGLPATAGLQYRILGLTRSTSHPVSQELAQLPGVEMVEKDWTQIDSAWLKD